MRFKLFGKNETRHDIAEFIYKNYYKTAYYTAYKYCDDHAMAEEAAQEAIFQAIKNFDQLKDSGKLESWLKAIARNNVLKMLKSMAKSPAVKCQAHFKKELEKIFHYARQKNITN
ncbi:RNA polymerase sigma factor [Pelotomaculum sp. FP]|uniref:sigma factor n=1 Tax=Pelotomaculum sp. FP TaxID=261474 RepID=UPI00110108E4|nr:sigma factor [Pelotomaculum sp. FP]TEB10088.1 RNA polymerase sigma factor [Pelotomaculum sp. FP]